MSRRKGQLKKNHIQLQQYKDFVSDSLFSPDSTVPYQNAMLIGSDEVRVGNHEGDLQKNDEIKKTPLKYRFVDWIKANLFVAIITTIVVGVATTVVTHKTRIAVISQRIDYIESRVELINEKDVEKEYLQIQLDLLKSELSNDTNTSLNEIKWKIKDIENRLDILEKDKD